MCKLSVFEQRYCIKCKYKKEANNKIFCTYPMECPEISEATSTGTPTIDQAIIAAHIIKSYCQEVSTCDRGHICPLGHMINCYETETCGFGPYSWDIPNPEEIGLCDDEAIGPCAAATIEEAIELLERGDYNVKKRTN